MIAFVTAIYDTERYRRFAWPGVQRVREADSLVLGHTSPGAFGRALNVALEQLGSLEGLEAVVVLGESTEIADPGFCAKIRAALAEPGVAAVGPVGARDTASLAWWEGEVSAAAMVHRYHEHGGGEIPAFGWTAPAPPPVDVDVLDGMLMVLAPWAARDFRFDEGLHHGFGHDLDLCLQLRAAGHRLRTVDLRLVTHAPLEVVDKVELWTEAHVALAEKWEGRLPGLLPETTDWRARARRAEAEREAARTVAYSNSSRLDAQVLEAHAVLTRHTSGAAWKLTAPLRRLKLHAVRTARARAARRG